MPLARSGYDYEDYVMDRDDSIWERFDRSIKKKMAEAARDDRMKRDAMAVGSHTANPGGLTATMTFTMLKVRDDGRDAMLRFLEDGGVPHNHIPFVRTIKNTRVRMSDILPPSRPIDRWLK